ncbi:6-phosphofructokinase [Cumulibacter manganitolerans]|uniref:6-phosphofructokinase n=1 Tax=Cumulibacter manganitolerans TaxID=1884992 RepID=UPI001E3C6064|nr:6-phosphofructokinase [Cumulibacter manganitolerans]
MPEISTPVRIGVLTSGGDAPGMNAALRAVVRSGLNAGAEMFAVHEGWQGAVNGGAQIVPMGWEDVSGILQLGGTVIGTARCAEFRDRAGRRAAVRNLLDRGIDRLVVIGGDGSLTGADQLRAEWSGLLDELVAAGELAPELRERHPRLMLVGLVGSIDNDMVGTEMTIGTDSALHRITDAIDAISSTAASHQRAFIIEVMGRNCGYLAVMSALAGGADYVFVPEAPPGPDWPERMCAVIRRAREAGRRDSIIVVAEGAVDLSGARITCDQVRVAVQEGLGQDARITDLGHVQRGGTPSAYDRWMASVVGVAATEALLNADAGTEPVVLGVQRNEVVRRPLMEAVEETRAVPALMAGGRSAEAVAARGPGFGRSLRIFQAISEADPTVEPAVPAKRIAIVHAGGLAPGMNTAVWAAVRLGIDAGHRMAGIQGGFPGFCRGDVVDLEWGDVEGWVSRGGAELGTRRSIPDGAALEQIARTIERRDIDALLVVGGYNAYEAVRLMVSERDRLAAFRLPIALLPASIDNNLPGWKMAIGADSALGVATEALDRVKQSASAHRRCFVVETMGRSCGFLALMSGLTSGAERVYLHEDGIDLSRLESDVRQMRAAFEQGRRFHLAIRNEEADPYYTTDVLARLFEAESGGRYDVRTLVIGHVQEGPSPSPFDRMTAARLAAAGIRFLSDRLADGSDDAVFAAESSDGTTMLPVAELDGLVDPVHRRPVDQWWHRLRGTAAAINERSFVEHDTARPPGRSHSIWPGVHRKFRG